MIWRSSSIVSIPERSFSNHDCLSSLGISGVRKELLYLFEVLEDVISDHQAYASYGLKEKEI